MKFKIFSGTVERVEQEINSFSVHNPNMVMVQQSSSSFENSGGYTTVTVVLVYKNQG